MVKNPPAMQELLFSHSVMSNSLRPHGLQHFQAFLSFTISWSLLKFLSIMQCKRPWFYPCVRKIPWRREWQLTPVFLPGKSYGQRSLASFSPWGCKVLDTTVHTHAHTHTYTPAVLEIGFPISPCPLLPYSTTQTGAILGQTELATTLQLYW